MFRGSYLFAAALLAALAGQMAHAQAMVGEVFASDASVRGTIMLTGGGTRVFSGSQVAAGVSPAVLKLSRGGEVRICPGTSLAVSASASGDELLLSVSTGALELHYPLDSAADSVMTPEFQIQLVGPGDFHIGIGADERGATCVRGLSQNSAAVIVSEMMGTGRYQVQPHEEVVFREGRVNSSQRGALAHCGCPEPPPVLRAELNPPPPIPTPAPPSEITVPAPLTPSAREPEVHVQVDAPFIYRANSPDTDIAWQVSRLQTTSKHEFAFQLLPTVVPPPEPRSSETASAASVSSRPPEKKSSGNVFKKIGSFFSRIFRG